MRVGAMRGRTMIMMARRASMALVAVALAVPLIAARADAFVY